MPPGGVDDIQSTVCISLREVGQLGRLAGGGTGPSHGCTGGGQVSAGGLPTPNEKHRSGKQIRARQQRKRSRQRMRTSARDGRKRGANAAAPSLHNTSISASTGRGARAALLRTFISSSIFPLNSLQPPGHGPARHTAASPSADVKLTPHPLTMMLTASMTHRSQCR